VKREPLPCGDLFEFLREIAQNLLLSMEFFEAPAEPQQRV